MSRPIPPRMPLSAVSAVERSSQRPEPGDGRRPRATASAKREWSVYALGIAVLLALVLALMGDDYWTNMLVMTLLFAGLASAWNIIGGYGGQLSLGHGVFFAIGAYTVALLFTDHQISPLVALVIGIPIAMTVAVVIAWPTLKLKGPFFAMATMALNQVALVLALFFDSFTGGPRGVSMAFQESATNLMFVDRWKSALVMLAFLAVCVAVTIGIGRTRMGYALRAVREDEDAAAAAGVRVAHQKVRGMVVSATLTSIGGGLYATYIGYVDPQSVLSLPEVGVRIALLALLGGIGTVWGPVVGAFVLIPAMSYLQSALTGTRPGLQLVVVGLMLVIIPLAMRRGIVGTIGDLWRQRSGRGATR